MPAYTPPPILRIALFIVAAAVVVANKKVVEANFASTFSLNTADLTNQK